VVDDSIVRGAKERLARSRYRRPRHRLHRRRLRRRRRLRLPVSTDTTTGGSTAREDVGIMTVPPGLAWTNSG